MAATSYRILSTPADRAVINKQNAQHSTGPRTEQGKSISRMNAQAHGLTSKQVVLPHENADEYWQLRKDLHADYKPANALEVTLVDELAQTYWRKKRAYAAETSFLADRVGEMRKQNPKLNGDEAMAKLFIEPAESSRLKLIMRYVSQAERAFNKALSELTNMQAERKRHEHKAAIESAWVRQAEAPSMLAKAQSGSVPSTIPETDASAEPGFVSHNEPSAATVLAAGESAAAL